MEMLLLGLRSAAAERYLGRKIASSITEILNATEVFVPGTYVLSWLERWNDHTQDWSTMAGDFYPKFQDLTV
ncbi:hypothetical protein BGZ51_001379 [Haplosporangium sp. Z 767]|nr:hypothetical protein BGZ51_001379 [Haplosporangium sp. Z 767]